MSLGQHYEMGEDGVELWDLTLRSSIHSNIYSAMKYIVRFDKKGSANADLCKAVEFLEKLEECPDYTILGALYEDVGLLEKFLGQFDGLRREILIALTQETFDNYTYIEPIISMIKKLEF